MVAAAVAAVVVADVATVVADVAEARLLLKTGNNEGEEKGLG